jgi:hypothetical protein
MDANIDPAKAEAFGAQMLQLINHATLSLMLSVGHRTGLFDTLAGMDPATSADIARAAKLDERYIRE